MLRTNTYYESHIIEYKYLNAIHTVHIYSKAYTLEVATVL